jgi:hypothetical protein
MRRNWLGGLLFALGLAIQALTLGAPAVARASAGPGRYAYEFCWRAGQSESRPDQDSDHRARLHFGCVFCQLAAGGLTPFVTTPSAAAFVSADSYLLRLRVLDAPPPPSTRGKSRQARAPPKLS